MNHFALKLGCNAFSPGPSFVEQSDRAKPAVRAATCRRVRAIAAGAERTAHAARRCPITVATPAHAADPATRGCDCAASCAVVPSKVAASRGFCATESGAWARALAPRGCLAIASLTHAHPA